MYKILDLDSWNRKDHFQFFKQFEEPFFGLTVKIDCTIAYQYSKKNGNSFFLYYLHKALVAANNTTPFRYRIIDDKVVVYETINASPTIGREDGTFGFSYMDYDEDFDTFNTTAKKEIDRVQSTQGLDPATSGDNVIHFSSMPWIDFTSLSHARNYSFNDSCPKISFGKMIDENGKKTMSVSIHVHHGLLDGYHVSLFIDEFQKQLNKSSI